MSENTQVITRKLALIPVASDTKQWITRFTEFSIENLNNRIIKNQEKFKRLPRKEEKKREELQTQIQNDKETLERFQETGEYTVKMVNDYTYTLIRKACASEAQRKNAILSWMYSLMIEDKVFEMSTDTEKNKYITEKIKPGYRTQGSKKGSLFDDIPIENELGGYGIGFCQTLTAKLKKAVKDGLLEGKVSLPCYKNDSPFTINRAEMGFIHDYGSYEEMCEHVHDKDFALYLNYGGLGSPTIAKFKFNLGNTIKNREELLATLLRVYSGEYKYCGSSIGIEKNKIILYLSMEIPKKENIVLDENIIVGVDLGQAIPAMCALNTDEKTRLSIGCKEEFLSVRTKLVAERRRRQKAASFSKGGHGRKAKLKSLGQFREREANFAQTYNHGVSKKVVAFAVDHHAKYINLECLKGYKGSKKILRYWSYYQLQQQIEYKASLYGIEVRKINPCYTSQVCSYCGHWEKGQRVNQEKFICKNKDCKSHKLFKEYVNADFNAARNIAKSDLWLDKEVKEPQKKAAREYYGIKLSDSDSGTADSAAVE